MSNFYKTCYVPFELWSDNSDSISFFLRLGQADMAFLLIIKWFYAIKECWLLLWNNRTSGSETVKYCCMVFCLLGSSVNIPMRCLGQLNYFKVLAELGDVRHASLYLR